MLNRDDMNCRIASAFALLPGYFVRLRICTRRSRKALSVLALTAATYGCATDTEQSTAKASCPKSSHQTECSCEKPTYPAESRRSGEEGTVRVAVVISAGGQVTHAEVTKSSGYPRLDAASVAAISKSCFKPAMRNGVPVEGRLEGEMVWRLEGGG
jgi:TonB family protein